MKIRTGDKVKVVSGKDAGKESKVLKVILKENKVLLEGINIVTRHIKKVGANPGQIVQFEKPIDASNVMLICPVTGKATRVGFTMIEEKGVTKKFRFSKQALKSGKSMKDAIIK
ncbi:MAG: 50S ribosomal protein L24 [Candidatus Gracilibacteria bacterium]|nr:50S ribosomal protein L24 [Candidatus Gracilibacteria bacterium]